MVAKNSRSKRIPKFVRKINQILEDPLFYDLIRWLPEERGFEILNCSRFIQEVLPHYFKHKNMSSFVRQLNMYGFNRPKDFNQHVYVNPRFIRQNMNSMRQISRKKSHTKLKQDFQIQYSSANCPRQQLKSRQFSILHKKLSHENEKLKEENQKLLEHLEILSQSSLGFSFFPCFESSFNFQAAWKRCQKSKQVFFEFQQVIKKEEDFPKVEQNWYENPVCNEKGEQIQNCSAETMQRN